MRILLDPFEEAEKLTTQRGAWTVGVIETRVFWPKKKQIISFYGRDFVLVPTEHRESTSILPAIALKRDSYELTSANARREIMRFASALSWREGEKIEIIMWSGGNLPRSMGLFRNSAVTEYLDAEHLPVAQTEASLSALAFYREGVSLDNPFYAFLSLYKAFSRAVPTPGERTPWINMNLSRLGDDRAKKRANELTASGDDVGVYLYGRCRNAVAHADREPFIDPDDADDHFRLTNDLPLMKEFAELAIEQAFNVKRKTTIWREHLYELSGFRELIPEDIRIALCKGENPPEETTVDFPDVLFLLARRGHSSYPLGPMNIGGAFTFNGGLCLDLESVAGSVRLRLSLNFAEEKLEFDPRGGFALRSDRSELDRVREELAGLRFQRCILSNGHLEVWDITGETRLGCTQSYIPKNCMVNSSFFEGEERELEAILNNTNEPKS